MGTSPYNFSEQKPAWSCLLRGIAGLVLLLEVPLARDFTCQPRPCWAAVPSAHGSSPANALSASSSTSPGASLLFYFGVSCIHISFCGQVSPAVLTPLRHCWEHSFHCSLQVCWEPKPGSAKTLTWSEVKNFLSMQQGDGQTLIFTSCSFTFTSM